VLQLRKKQISLIDTPYYYCASRCVWRSFLCGENKFMGQSYGHCFGGGAEKRLLFLSSIFAINICAYAVSRSYQRLATEKSYVFCGQSQTRHAKRYCLHFD
jgi:hypothetical protein